MLSDDSVRELRRRYSAGERQIDLAAEFGINQNTVSSIVTGRTRAAAGGPISRGQNRKLDASDALEIRHAVADGASTQSLVEFYGVSQQMISNVVTGRAFREVGGPLQSPGQTPRRRLTVEEAEEIRRRSSAGHDRLRLASAFGISPWTVDWVLRDRTPARRSKEDRDRTRADVEQMRELYQSGVTQTEIGRRFGLTQQMVGRIVHGEAHVTTAGPRAAARVRRLTEATVVRIRQAFAAGTAIGELADRHDTTPAIVRQVVTGASYAMAPGPIFTLDRAGRAIAGGPTSAQPTEQTSSGDEDRPSP